MAEYCTVEEVGKIGIAASALQGIDPTDLLTEIQSASDIIDGYLGAKFTLPLSVFGRDIRRACAVVAGWHALLVRGVSPEGDQAAKLAYDEVMLWLRDVAKGLVTPAGIVDSSPAPIAGVPTGGPRVASATSRGYTTRGTGRTASPGDPFSGG